MRRGVRGPSLRGTFLILQPASGPGVSDARRDLRRSVACPCKGCPLWQCGCTKPSDPDDNICSTPKSQLVILESPVACCSSCYTNDRSHCQRRPTATSWLRFSGRHRRDSQSGLRSDGTTMEPSCSRLPTLWRSVQILCLCRAQADTGSMNCAGRARSQSPDMANGRSYRPLAGRTSCCHGGH
ncbi:hypothetical protein EJ03DRAFT_46857 [Teratosphaeria nubilosa]|uniref:Uncharacterized protein n=1 Tax=Teratosphaeria nubilosa TaxID=161662 RepID=A0A6G1LEY8_9PEZI|nr:hypothetical protein EJ03DRAFT_46857 [Teratosphaeria nubilosa]